MKNHLNGVYKGAGDAAAAGRSNVVIMDCVGAGITGLSVAYLLLNQERPAIDVDDYFFCLVRDQEIHARTGLIRPSKVGLTLELSLCLQLERWTSQLH